MGELNNFFVSFGAVTKDFLKGKKEVEEGLKQVDATAKAQGKSMEQSGKQAEAALDRTGNAAVEAKGKIAQLTEISKATHAAMKNMATQMQILGGVITGALTAIVYKSAELGDKIDDLTKRTGVSAEELSRWGYVAEQNGSSLDQMALALKNLYTRMDEASRGAEQYKEVFDRLGISIYNTNGSLKSGTQMIPEIADKIANLSSEVEQSAILADLFGQRVGPDLLPMLQMGSGGIKVLADEADRIGRTMSGETAKALGDFNDSITALKASVGGLAAQFVESLVPAIQPLIQWLTNLIGKFTQWREQNQALFDTLAKIAALSGPLLILGGVFLKLIVSVSGLSIQAKKLGETFAILQADVKKFFSFFTTPAGIATAAIAGIATAVYLLYDRWKGVIERTEQAREALIRIKDGKASIEEIKAALDGAEEAINRNIISIQKWHTNLNNLSQYGGMIGSFAGMWNEILGIEKRATGEIEAQTQLLKAEMAQATQIAAQKITEGYQGATQAEKETLTEAIKLNESVKHGSKEMETFRIAIDRVKEELATMAPGTDQFKTSQEALNRLEKGYTSLLNKYGDEAAKFNEIFKSLTDEQREFVLTGKQKEIEIHKESLLERLDAEKNFSELLIDEQIKVLEEYKKNSDELTEEEKKDIENLLDKLKTKFDELNQAAKERLDFTKTLLDLSKISSVQYIQFLKDELTSEQNTTDQKKNIRNELLSFTSSLYTKNLDDLESANQKAIDLERDTAEKRKEIYSNYAQKVIEKEEEINQIRQKYADRQKELGASIRTQLISDLAGYGENLSGLFNKSTEELAELWKRAAESGKSMTPLTEDVKRQVELYGEAWEEAAKQIDLATKVEEFLNLDVAMQEEIAKVDAQFADFETKTAESLDKVNLAFMETGQTIEESFKSALENIGISMEVLAEKFGIELDSIEEKLNQFAGKQRKEEPVETAAKELVYKSLPTVEALREYAKAQETSTDAYQDSAEKIKLNIKSQEQLAKEIYNQKNKLIHIIADVKDSGILEASEGISSYSVATGQLVKTEYPELFKTKPVQDIAPAAEIKPEFPNISAVLPPEKINQSTDAVRNLGSTFKQNFIPLTGDATKGLVDISKEMGGFQGTIEDAAEAVKVLNEELMKLAGQNIKVEIDVQGTEKAGQQVVFKALEQSLLSGGRR